MHQRLMMSVFAALTLAACGGKGGDATTGDSTDSSTGGSSEASSEATTDPGTGGTTAGTTGTTDPSTDPSGPEPDLGCEFVCMTDVGIDAQCDNWTQDCPEGEKCAAWANDGGNAWNATKCVDVMGEGLHGDDCTAPMGGVGGEDTCALGHMCWNIDNETGIGVCIKLCGGNAESPSCEPADSICFVSNGGVLNLCLPTCDPIIQDCAGSNVCIPDPSGQAFMCVLDASGGDGLAGTPCEFSNACNPGNMCLNVDFYPHPDCQGSAGCCGPFCDFSDPDAVCPTEPMGLSCESWFEEGMAPPGYDHVGICIVPQ